MPLGNLNVIRKTTKQVTSKWLMQCILICSTYSIDFHWLACLGVRPMSILHSGVIVQNMEDSSLVVEVKEKGT